MRFGIAVLVCILFCSSVLADNRCFDSETKLCTYHPMKKEPEDPDLVLLPMPDGLQMVFRKVEIPGSHFWFDPQRLIKVGDIQRSGGDSAIFEGVVKVPITGSFFDTKKQNWFYLLGQYEVTVAQYAAVMGGGLKKGLDYFYRNSSAKELIDKIQSAISKKDEKSAYQFLANPAVGLSWFDYQDFIRNYNDWCFKTDECLNKMPRLPESLTGDGLQKESDNPGFFRLPTELEWEYAARGGMQTRNKKLDTGEILFEADLPFEIDSIGNYAWVSLVTNQGYGPYSIAELEPVFGFYDLFGNATEITAQAFNTELIQGKPGAIAVRGGHYKTNPSSLRTSGRSELELYKTSQKDGKTVVRENRYQYAGIRLSIGSLVIQSLAFRQDITDQYHEYAETKGMRDETAAGKSVQNGIARGGSDVGETSEFLETVVTQVSNGVNKNEKLENQLRAAKEDLNIATQKIEAGIKSVCEKLASNASLILQTAAWHYQRAEVRRSLLDKMKSMSLSSETLEKNLRETRVQYEDHVQMFEDNFAAYVQTVQELGGYQSDYVTQAITELRHSRGNAERDRIIYEVVNVLNRHVTIALQGGLNPQQWRHDVQELGKVFASK